jgi:phospholipase C
VSACSDDEAGNVLVCSDAPAGPVSPAAEEWDTGRSMRDRCEFTTGDPVTKTIGSMVGSKIDVQQIPIKHVVVLMMENRSFDHLFSDLKDEGVDTVQHEQNPDPSKHGEAVQQYHDPTVCEPLIPGGPDHEWGPSHLQYDNGKMDGFVAASNPMGKRAMRYYKKADIPFYYWLAANFAISERHFSSLIGPTWPNRLFTVAATSCGYSEGYDSNLQIGLECGATRPNIFEKLGAAGVSFKVFTDGAIPYASSLFFDIFALNDFAAYDDIGAFEELAASNTLPAVSFIEPNYESETKKLGGAPNDDHPPANIQRGQLFVHEIVMSLMQNPDTWRTTALFITYDEHGGYYDHVAPPRACDPEGRDFMKADYAFDRLGFRVPLIVVSPYAKRHYVSRYVTDHTSILRFIEGWQGLGALTPRDANAWPMLDIFDFAQAPTAPPQPGDADRPILDPVADATCPEH